MISLIKVIKVELIVFRGLKSLCRKSGLDPKSHLSDTKKGSLRNV